jgi:beta-glucanase (GH16 family)
MIQMLLMLANPTYQLVFNDEFDTPGRVDGTKWTYEMGFVRNRELQWYQRSNVSVADGFLVIEARKERVINPNYDPKESSAPKGAASQPGENWKKARQHADYTSGSIKTRGLHSWRFGRFEARMKIQPVDGLWPAFWCTGDEKKWPSCGEIDIMEYYQQQLHANTLYGDGSGKWDAVKKPMSHFYKKDPEWAQKFHVWRMDWDAKWIRLYVDDELLNETDITNTKNADGFNPLQQKHQIILNLAIGSTAGDPKNVQFPARFLVDYVRVYQIR